MITRHPRFDVVRGVVLALAAMLLVTPANAQDIVTGSLAYNHQGVTLSAYIAQPAVGEDADVKLPGVLVCHAWM